jgi:hypothetical protein
MDFKKGFDSVIEKILNNIFMEFCRPMKLVVLSKIRLSETYSEV